MRYDPVDPGLFKNNRRKFNQYLQPGSVAVFHSNDVMPKTADQFFPFKQNSDLFYLTGIDQEETILVLAPDFPQENFREVLFILKTTEELATWEGDKLTKEKAREISGIESIRWVEDFDKLFPVWMNHAKYCYLNANEHGRFNSPVRSRDNRFAGQIMEDYPMHNYHRSAPIMHRIRSIKSQQEIDLMQKACDITANAFDKVLKFVEPGVGEYEIEAEITSEFIRNRSEGHAYDPIIASGKSACVLHYTENKNICRDGELILFDFGASWSNYAADMSRTIPVNGRFSERQKAVYNAVLRTFKEARNMLRPGILLSEYQQEVGKMIEKELINLKVLSKADVDNQDPENPLYKKYFMHGTSHFIGLDVHDVGNRYEPIRKGMAFTCEPGIYLPEEGIGIRLENDIIVTDDEPIDLMKDIPIEPEEIEDKMNG